MLQRQWCSWVCDECAALLLGHFPILVEMEVPEFGEGQLPS
jgi:hypothetical protein